MANAIEKPEKLVSQGLGLLRQKVILPSLVTRLSAADFVGAKNDTVDIKIPSLLAGREYNWRNDRTNPITVDELNEQSIPVQLNHHFYNAIGLTDEELTLDIDSWGAQVATPQLNAVADKTEGALATAIEAADTQHTVEFDPDLSNEDDRAFWKAAVAARKALNTENVPQGGRVIVLGADVEEAALQSKHLVDVDTSGASEALREAIIGRIAGFTVIGGINALDPDFAMAFHPTAFGFANVAPAVPGGVSAGATTSYEGLALRWIKDYDSDHLRDRSVYSSFAGAVSVEDGRVMDPSDPNFGDLTSKNVRAVTIDYVAGS